MLRILPQEVKTAYQAKNIVPKPSTIIDREYYDSPIECCGLGAVLFMPDYHIRLSDVGRPTLVEEMYQKGEALYGEDYFGGFMNGFDGHGGTTAEGERGQEGFRDGRAARALVLPS